MPPRRRITKTDRTYWILDRRQIECLASPRRQDLLDRLVAMGPSSVREFSAPAGLAASATYHHLRALVAAGLVVDAGSRVVNRRVERLYAARAPRMRLARALGVGAVRGPMRRFVAALCRQADKDFAGGLAHPRARVAGAQRNLGFFRLVGSPGRAELAEINRHLDRIAEILWRQPLDPSAAVVLAWTFAPLDPRSSARPNRRRKS